MGLPNDPEKIPKERGWEVVPVFSLNGFSLTYLSALQEIESDSEVAGYSDVGVRNLLFTLILSLRPECVLELGGHIGSAALVMGEGLRLNGYGKLYTVEPEAHYLERLSYYVKKAELEGIVIPLKGFSYEVQIRQKIESVAPFELIFIDACHDYSAVLNELLYCSDLIAQHGLIILHDSSIYAQSFDTQRKGGVRRAILECCKEKPELQAVFFEYPLWLNPCGAAILCKQSIIEKSKKKNFFNADLYSRIRSCLKATNT
jgi:predicted O-methyltransferase YrrM